MGPWLGLVLPSPPSVVGCWGGLGRKGLGRKVGTLKGMEEPSADYLLLSQDSPRRCGPASFPSLSPTQEPAFLVLGVASPWHLCINLSLP